MSNLTDYQEFYTTYYAKCMAFVASPDADSTLQTLEDRLVVVEQLLATVIGV